MPTGPKEDQPAVAGTHVVAGPYVCERGGRVRRRDDRRRACGPDRGRSDGRWGGPQRVIVVVVVSSRRPLEDRSFGNARMPEVLRRQRLWGRRFFLGPDFEIVPEAYLSKWYTATSKVYAVTRA
ncbi:unnamed protein product [Linum trigynum]